MAAALERMVYDPAVLLDGLASSRAHRARAGPPGRLPLGRRRSGRLGLARLPVGRPDDHNSSGAELVSTLWRLLGRASRFEPVASLLLWSLGRRNRRRARQRSVAQGAEDASAGLLLKVQQPPRRRDRGKQACLRAATLNQRTAPSSTGAETAPTVCRDLCVPNRARSRLQRHSATNPARTFVRLGPDFRPKSPAGGGGGI